MARWAVPVTVAVFALAGAGEQRKHPLAPRPAVKRAPPLQPDPHEGAIRDNNLGLALMDRRQFQNALGKFQRACITYLESDIGCLNMGIALLHKGEIEKAQSILAKSAERDPQNARAWFNLGLLDRTRGRPEAAIEDLERVAAIDPSDVETQCLIGLIYFERREDAKAIAAFKVAVDLDPALRSAELDLAQADERAGDANGVLVHLERLRHIFASHLGQPTSPAYGEQGKYSLAQELLGPEQVPVAISVHFLDVTSVSGLTAPVTSAIRPRDRPNKAKRGRNQRLETRGQEAAPGPSPEATMRSLAGVLGSGACIFDYDGDGKPDIFLVNAGGGGNSALFRNLGHGKFVDVRKTAKLEFHGEGTGCAVGDYDNDGLPDLAVSSNGRVVLYHNEGNGEFKDVAGAAGIDTDGLSLGVTFIDYDHDGDLDLYVTRFTDFPVGDPDVPFAFPYDARPPGNVLWRNKGNGAFMDWTSQTALGGNASSVGAVGTDLNNDRAVDIVTTGWEKPPSVLLNQRDGTFRAITPWTADMPRHPAGVTALDFDKDGWMDLAFTHWAPPGLSLWRNVTGKSFERVALPGPAWMRGWGVAAFDYDNDGWVDLVAVGENLAGEGCIILLRNEGDKGYRDVTHETGLDRIVLHNPRGVIAFDYDGDGSTDLLITQNSLPPVLLKNVGAEKNHWLQLGLQGERDNKFGIGTRVELFAGAERQQWEVPGASGYLGQGPAEILAGLGSRSLADVVRLLWPTGVLQDEVEVSAGKRDVIAETDDGGAQP